MIPYLPSLSWCTAIANGRVPDPPFKGRYNRSLILGPDGEMQLSVPVIGGITAVKKANPQTWICADDKNWRHQHLGAINAAYGRTPFFIHFFPIVEKIINDSSVTSIEQLNNQLYIAIAKFLELEKHTYILQKTKHSKLIATVKSEIMLDMPPSHVDVSIIHHIFHFGKDTIFLCLG